MFNKFYLPALLLALLPLQSFARDYSVEAIIFNHTVGPDSIAVKWDEKAPRNIRAQTRLDRLYREAEEASEAREAAALLETGTPATSARDEPAGESEQTPIRTEVIHELKELQTIHDRLVESPVHEILQTLSWQQSEANYSESPLINTVTPHMMGVLRIYAPNLLFAELDLLYTPGEIIEERLLMEQEQSIVEVEAEPVATIESSFASFSFDPEGNLLTTPEPVVERYYLDEQRKLKLNEIHYFDHPRFGVILMVRPLEEKKP